MSSLAADISSAEFILAPTLCVGHIDNTGIINDTEVDKVLVDKFGKHKLSKKILKIYSIRIRKSQEV